ncbi:MAG: FG-GAP-like repeat-containing protein, partial [Anaeromyxobacteraceae bacterium]
GQLLSNASIAAQDTVALQSDQLLPPHNIERMIVGSPCSPEEQVTLTCPIDADPVVKVYDAGFYNIGVRPTDEDLGVGAKIGPLDLPLSHAQRLSDCVVAKAPPGSSDLAVRQANLACATPHIAARPIEAATLLLKAWSLASLNGLEGDKVGTDGKTIVKPGANTIGNLIAQSRSLLTGNPLSGASYQLASCPPATQPPSAFAPLCPSGTPGLLFQARDLLAAAIPTLTDQGLSDANRAATCPGLDPAASCVQQRVANLLAAATLLLPDPVNPGPGINAAGLPEAFAPPLQPGERTNVRGGFKVPGLRNVELTAPFFHNGGQATLEQVVQFYDRGGDFARENLQDLDPNIAPIHLLPYEEEGLAAFMKALTDDRVKWERAPFDHPSLSIPNGGTLGQSVLFGGVPLLDDRIVLPAAGAAGNPIPLGSPGTPFANFPDPVWSQIGAVSGAGQQAAPGAALPGHLAVEVRDAGGNPVQGVVVTFHAPSGATVSPAQVTTGADGRAEAAATLSPDSGAQTFQAEAFAVVGSPLALVATAVPPTPPPVTPSPVTPSTPPAAFASASAGGCSSGPGGGLSALLLAAAAILVRRRRALLAARRALAASAAVALAVLSGCGGVPTPDVPVADPAHSTLTVAPASPVADGVASATVAVVVRDAKGAALAGRSVSFSVGGSGNALSAPQATTGADGSATVALTSTKAEAKAVQAAVAGVALAPASVTFVHGSPSAARSTLTPADLAPVVGARVALTAAVRDAQGNPIPGAAVVLVAPDATSLAQPAAPTDAGGEATGGAISASSVGPKLVTALVGSTAVATATIAYVAYAEGTFCGGITVDASHDAANCGACGNACAAAEVCSAGACVAASAVSCATIKLPPGAPAALVGLEPWAIASADLDGDGIPDLAVANAGDGTVSILTGVVGGTFTTPLPIPVGNRPVAIAAADVDGDGRMDLVVVNQGDGSVTILLGTQAGLAPQPPIAVGVAPAFVSVADLDLDGLPDLVVANSGDDTVSVLMNDRASPGVFKPQGVVPVGGKPLAVAIADLDGDGKPDLAVANNLEDTLTVLLQGAGGTFSPAPPLVAVQDPRSILALDLDGDGKPDLAIVNASAVPGARSHTVTVVLNTTATAGGPLAFSSPVDVDVGTDPITAVAGDLDGDGKPDLVVPSGNDDAVFVLLNRSAAGAAAFSVERHTAGFLPFAVAVADLDGDGKADLAVASLDADAVTILPNLGGGTFAPPATFTARPTYTVGASPDAVAAADLSGHGKVDVAVANAGDDTVTVFRNRGDGALVADPQPYAAGHGPSALALVDLDGDGARDLAVADAAGDAVSVLRNLGSAGFATPVSYPTGAPGAKPVAIAAADLDGDGAPDLVVANAGAGGVAVLLNNGHGAFLAAVPYPTGTAPSAVVVADLDGDGAADLAVTDAQDGSVSVLRGDKAHRGTFLPLLPGDRYVVGNTAAPSPVAPDPVALVAVDLDGDGRLDLAVANAADSSVSVLVNVPAHPGTFKPSVRYGVAVSPRFLAAADLDKDGLMDLVVASGPIASAGPTDGYRALTVLRNDPKRQGTLFQRAYDQLLVTPLAVATADLDGNGRADVVLLGSEGLLPLLSVCAP